MPIHYPNPRTFLHTEKISSKEEPVVSSGIKRLLPQSRVVATFAPYLPEFLVSQVGVVLLLDTS